MKLLMLAGLLACAYVSTTIVAPQETKNCKGNPCTCVDCSCNNCPDKGCRGRCRR